MRLSIIIVSLVLFLGVNAQKVDTIKVKVHDHDMTMYVAGRGNPTIILEAGLGATHKAWSKIDSVIKKETRVVSYDRPGYLNSDSCSKSRDALTIATELREALYKADIHPPYVLAGWSLGGAFVRVFAGLYPKDVVGLVLVDPAPEDSYKRFETEHPALYAEEKVYIENVMKSDRIGQKGELIAFDSSMNHARKSDAQHVTLTRLLIAAGNTEDGQDRDPSNPLNKIWIEELEKWALKRPNTSYTVLANSGHHIAKDQPNTVIHAIKDLVTTYQLQKLKESATSYKRPPQLNDGLITATLKDVGMNKTYIEAMTDSLTSGIYPNIHSVLILRNNKLVYEHYFPGNDFIRGCCFKGFTDNGRDSLHDQRSVTKSVVGAAIMIAVGQKKIKSLHQRVFEFFPEYAKYDTGMKRNITIQHLLNMSPGLEWDEQITYLNPKNSEIMMNNAMDAIDFVLSQKLIDTPGKKFNYSGGTTQVLAAIVEKATGLAVDKYVETYLFNHLGIKTFTWVKIKDGSPSAASGLRMRSRDMAKFGLLFMNKGKWNGRQIIPQELSSSIFTSQISTPFTDPVVPHVGYSNQFWVETQLIKGKEITVTQAQGNGGQMIIMDKKQNIVLVITSGNYNQRNLKKTSYDIYPDFVYPALIKK